MQMKLSLIVLALLAGCAPACPVLPVVVPLPEPVAAVPVTPTPLANAAANYSAVARKEASAVTAPGVDADYVRQVHGADREAQRALTSLQQKPSAATRAKARATVSHLNNLLANAPKPTADMIPPPPAPPQE